MTQFPLPVARTSAELRARVRDWRRRGERVGLVPTMGAPARGPPVAGAAGQGRRAARVVTSVFVNPTQFAPSEDFAAYPRDEGRDAELLASVGCDVLYAPSVEQMYPQGFATAISVGEIALPQEGQARPGHFAGVATVVAKLLIQAEPDVAVFGEKDYHELLVIRRLAADLDLPVQILGAPTVRAQDGLARSSRNDYLSEAERAVAGRLNVILRDAAAAVAGGAEVAQAEAEASRALIAAGFDSVDYVAVRAADDLSALAPGPLHAPARILAAARIGRTRLIDNMAV